jgi:ketosteroid isomerase-like protein
MRIINLLIIIGVINISCTSSKKSEWRTETIKQEVIDTELAFSNFSKQYGFARALAKYAADDAIKLNPRNYATIGKLQLQKEAEADTVGISQGIITWKPLKIDVSESGDLASAFGDYYYTFKLEQTTRDTTLYGNYITIWKKQTDGTWKFIIDGGNPTPGATTDLMLETMDLINE